METLLQNLRYGARMLQKSPLVTSVAVISLALGISANTVIFSVVNAVLLKSLPYQDPDRIVLAWGDLPSEEKHRTQVSATDVDDWRHQNSVFEEITTYSNWSATLLGEGEPERIQGTQVGDGFFSILKATPMLGRTFLPEEQEEGKDRVIVLGYGIWQTRFGADQSIVGRNINLSGRSYTVVGVLGPEFRPLPVTLVSPRGDFYRPVAEAHDENERSARHLRAIARLNSGVTLEQAQAEISVIASRIEQEHPRDNTGYRVRLATLTDDTVGGLRRPLLLLFGAVGFVLLIACANVGNLLLVRASVRQKEIAIRLALGAARTRLAEQLLTESVLLGFIGGALGLLLALWGVGIVESAGSKATPLLSNIKIDTGVLVFTFALSIITGLVFGLAPALRASRVDLNEVLKDGGRGTSIGASTNRLRSALVIGEVALSLVLLVGAGLLISTIIRLSSVNPGFSAENRLTMDLIVPSSKYPKPEQWIQFFDQLGEKLDAIPEIKAAGFTSILPLGGNFDGRGLAVEDHPKPSGQELDVDLYVITPEYLKTMAVPVLYGRAFSGMDRADSPLVALINETMAKALWPDESPLGKRVKFVGSARNQQPWRTIVGVVNNVKQYALDQDEPMQIYLPESQFPTTVMTMVVHSDSDSQRLIAAVRGAVSEMDKDLALFNIKTMGELLSDSIALRRFLMVLLVGFAGVALTLAAVGIYGVISYSVTQRTHEIGVRMALGAARADVLRLVLGQGVVLAGAGVGIGLAVAFLVTRLMTSLLFGITASDPLTFVVVSTLITGVALGASFVPALRAAKVDPMVALRGE